MSVVEALLEAQILRATEREDALETKFAAFEAARNKHEEEAAATITELKEQVASLKASLGKIGKPFDDGYGGSGVSVWNERTPPAVMSHSVVRSEDVV